MLLLVSYLCSDLLADLYFITNTQKESLNPKLAGAVSLYVKDTTKYSKYKTNIKIISSEDTKNKMFGFLCDQQKTLCSGV